MCSCVQRLKFSLFFWLTTRRYPQGRSRSSGASTSGGSTLGPGGGTSPSKSWLAPQQKFSRTLDTLWSIASQFPLWVRPGPRWGSLQHSPDPLYIIVTVARFSTTKYGRFCPSIHPSPVRPMRRYIIPCMLPSGHKFYTSSEHC